MKWITAVDVSSEDDYRHKKTKTFSIHSKTGYGIGLVMWYAQWRQYCLFPLGHTIWNRECLDEVSVFINQLMENRKKEPRKARGQKHLYIRGK